MCIFIESAHLNHRTYHTQDDQTLLDLYYAEFDNEILGVLLQRYTMLLLGVCMKYLKEEADAKDAAQQVIVKVIQVLPKSKVTYFKSWLYIVAKNHCLMQLRNKKHLQLAMQEELGDDSNSESPLLEQLMAKEKDLDRLNEGIQLLNPAQKACIKLFYFEKKSYQEICETTGYSVLQVKSYIQNGKRNLKIMIEKRQSNG